MRQLTYAAAILALMSPAFAQTVTETKPAAAETKPAEATAAEKKVDEAKSEATTAATKPADGAAETTETEKKQLTPEETAELAKKLAALAEAKAAALGDGDPRALIIDTLGFTEPRVDAFDELKDGASLLLETTAEISLTYYPTCEDLTIRGGRISINGDKMVLENATIVSRDKAPCPGSVRLSPADVVNASVVTRSIASKPIISTTPIRIGVVGPGAAKYTDIGVYGVDGTIFESSLKGRGAVWPKDGANLEAGKLYTVVLTGPGTQMFAARVVADEAASPVTVFRLK